MRIKERIKRRVCVLHKRERARQKIPLVDKCLRKCSQNDRLDCERVLIFEPHAFSKFLPCNSFASACVIIYETGSKLALFLYLFAFDQRVKTIIIFVFTLNANPRLKMKQPYFAECSKYVYENIYLHEISPIFANILYYFKEGGLMVLLAHFKEINSGSMWP